MSLKQILAQELQETHKRFNALLDSIPEKDYSLPTDNPEWTVGDVLFHITLGPRALTFEIWMLVHMRGLFQFSMDHFPSKMFNQVNARFGRQGKRVSRQSLTEAYGKAHAVIRSRLRRTREVDLARSVVYPPEFVSDLAGEVTAERLFRYATKHFEVHEQSLRRLRKP